VEQGHKNSTGNAKEPQKRVNIKKTKDSLQYSPKLGVVTSANSPTSWVESNQEEDGLDDEEEHLLYEQDKLQDHLRRLRTLRLEA
jgi:hypothetical protein